MIGGIAAELRDRVYSVLSTSMQKRGHGQVAEIVIWYLSAARSSCVRHREASCLL